MGFFAGAIISIMEDNVIRLLLILLSSLIIIATTVGLFTISESTLNYSKEQFESLKSLGIIPQELSFEYLIILTYLKK